MGQPAPTNPLSSSGTTPFLQELLGGPLLAEKSIDEPQLLLKPLDATLGIKGLPQSATGQTALYTGRNAPAFLGRHVTGFANGSLRILIEESGIFRQTLEAGGIPTHANLYSPGYFEAIEKRRIRYSVGTLVGLTAGVPFRMPEDYHRGEAIFWDITGQHMQERGVDAGVITAAEAGQRLAQIGAQNNVTLFECYLPDFAGHSQNFDLSVEVLRLVDDFLQSVVKSLPSDVTLIISSDHGNVEDLSTKSHTLNAVPLLVVGQDASAFRPIKDITGITPKIIELLSA